MEKEPKPKPKAPKPKAPVAKASAPVLYGKALNVRKRLRAGIKFTNDRWTKISPKADVEALRADPCIKLEER